MSKSQSSNVDGRCDGDEMSFRDQKVGTSYLDRVKEDVSLEYFTLSNNRKIVLCKWFPCSVYEEMLGCLQRC